MGFSGAICLYVKCLGALENQRAPGIRTHRSTYISPINKSYTNFWYQFFHVSYNIKSIPFYDLFILPWYLWSHSAKYLFSSYFGGCGSLSPSLPVFVSMDVCIDLVCSSVFICLPSQPECQYNRRPNGTYIFNKALTIITDNEIEAQTQTYTQTHIVYNNLFLSEENTEWGSE